VDQMYAEGKEAVGAVVKLDRMYQYEQEHNALMRLPEGVKLLFPEYLMDANIDGGVKG
jgi:hypothetical protein